MSLLMDALKKAELAKRQGRNENDLNSNRRLTENSPGDLTLEPLISSATSVSLPITDASPANATTPSTTFTAPADSLPHLSSHLESLDDAFLAEIETTPRHAPSVSARAAPASPKLSPQPATSSPAAPQSAVSKEHSSAQNLFTAKHPLPGRHSKNFAPLLGGATALAVTIIGIYFWWQLQPHSPAPVTPLPYEIQQTNLATTSTATTTAVPPAPTFPASTLPATNQAAAAPIPLIANATATNSQGGNDDAEDSVAEKPKSRSRSLHQSPPNSRSADDANDSIYLTKAPQKVNPSLLRGFDAFNRGDIASAHTEYTRALQSDPRNTDALHGLAAISQKQGYWDQAAQGYQKILEANPQDAIALAALINIRSQINPVTAESRLKMLIATQPELAAPSLSLGNLYARQERWNEAQQAYFQAYNADPDNPDILYNLAISLEHIRQTQLAVQYYSQAISAAKNHPAGFDSVQAAARIQALQP